MDIEIRQPLFCGYLEVRALWFDLPLLGEAEARRRVLGHWQAGSQLFLAAGGYLLAWPAPRWRHVEALDALALCRVGEVLSSAPLTAAELDALPAGAYWLVRGGVAQAAVPQARVDPAPWLALDAIALRQPLAPPPPPVELTMQVPMALGDVLGEAMPVRSADSIGFARKEIERIERDGEGTGVPEPSGARAAALAAGVALGVLGLLARGLGAGGAAGAGQGTGYVPAYGAGTGTGTGKGAAKGPGQDGGAGQGKRAGPGPWARRLSALMARLASLTRVSKVLGWRQATYLQQLFDLFDKGDLAEALRHAVPIDTIGGGASRPALGRPRPRTSLTVSGPSPSAPSINFAEDLVTQLRAAYRRSFERLDREGRIDEAVYVLAELLQCPLEAVTYLEKKERYLQAAQLAGTVELAPAVAVRLWVLAGDIERAVRVARLHNDFDAAVRLLEGRDSEHAAPLRRAWAEYLAARGDLMAAIDVIWPLPEHHALALGWLVQAERSGGTLGMQALARKLALMPGTLRSSAVAIDALLAAPGEEGVQRRARLAVALVGALPASDATRRVAGALLRKVLPERMEGLSRLDKTVLMQLTDLAANDALRADLPLFSTKDAQAAPGMPLSGRSAPLVVSPEERGLMPIHDARALPDGDYLLALGESGVVRIGRDGVQLAHYPVPAAHLVISHNGKRALALMARERTYRVSRLDLISGAVSDWLTLELTHWSLDYDGVSWNVALERRLAVLDTSAPQQSIVWQVADLPGPIVGYADRAGALTLLLKVDDGIEQWSYEQPGRHLRQRDWWNDIAWHEGMSILPGAAGEAPYLVSADWMNEQLLVAQHGKPKPVTVALESNTPLTVIIDGKWLVLMVAVEQAVRCQIATLADGKVRARVELAQDDAARFSFHDGRLLVFDRAGRLVDIDCASGLAHSLCLS
ncbi:bpX6 domain-containing protein [Massilia sp. CCM 8734]|uniref:bpX6 domain-containing protein n=1 Tax=Massilia sp. CCM 8734 TaxID=2609283 RepID=UPI0014241818|nr:bpX6 domain-containing protein [Massilia sp. CCM 8734]